MGQTFSLSHKKDETSERTSSIMLLKYEKSSLIPVSFLDFIKEPVSYSSSPIVMIEPSAGSTPKIDEQPVEKIHHSDLMRTLFQTFQIVPYQFTGFRLWLFTSNTISQSIIRETMDFCRNHPFSDYSCSLAIEPVNLFYDIKNIKSLSAAMRPPSASFRCSSPLRSPQQLSCQGPNFLLLRRSHQQMGSTSNPANNNQPSSNAPNGLFRIQTTFATKHDDDELNDGVCQSTNTSMAANAYDMVDDGLYIGNEMTASNREILTELGITHIVTLNGDTWQSICLEGFTCFTVNMNDSSFQTLDDQFWDAVGFTKRAINGGGKVFVHCRRGISRSAALCVAYLMDKKKLSYDTAFAILKTKRPAVNINPGFIEQLRSREQMSKTGPFQGRGKPPLLKLRL